MKTLIISFLLLCAPGAFADPVKLGFIYDEEDFVNDRALGFRVYAVPIGAEVQMTEILVADLITHETGDKGVTIDLDPSLRWHIYFVIFNPDAESDPSNSVFFGKPVPPGQLKKL